MTPAEFDAFNIKKAVAGLGTDESALIEIICSRTNEELQAMKTAYKKCIQAYAINKKGRLSKGFELISARGGHTHFRGLDRWGSHLISRGKKLGVLF